MQISPMETSRRHFLRAMVAAAVALPATAGQTDDGVQMDPQLEALRRAEEETRQRLARQADNVLDRRDKRLTVTWPDNTQIYCATTQNWPSWPNLKSGINEFLERTAAAARQGRHRTLDSAARSLRGGWCWQEVPFTPQVPVFSTPRQRPSGWRKEDNGKKERYVLLISGDGRRGSRDAYFDSDFTEFRQALAQWRTRNPRVDHERDDNFIRHLKDTGQTHTLAKYLNILEEEARFKRSVNHFAAMLTDVLAVPNDANHIKALHAPTPREVSDVFQTWVAPRQQKGAEFILVYNGHGELEADVPENSPQGLAEGLLMVTYNRPLSKTRLKVLWNQYARDFDEAAVVLGACHSGAFSA